MCPGETLNLLFTWSRYSTLELTAGVLLNKWVLSLLLNKVMQLWSNCSYVYLYFVNSLIRLRRLRSRLHAPPAAAWSNRRVQVRVCHVTRCGERIVRACVVAITHAAPGTACARIYASSIE